jgi:hypothetical protein
VLDVVAACARQASARYDPLDADANISIGAVCRRLLLPPAVEQRLRKHSILGLTALLVRRLP